DAEAAGVGGARRAQDAARWIEDRTLAGRAGARGARLERGSEAERREQRELEPTQHDRARSDLAERGPQLEQELERARLGLLDGGGLADQPGGGAAVGQRGDVAQLEAASQRRGLQRPQLAGPTAAELGARERADLERRSEPPPRAARGAGERRELAGVAGH